MDLQEFGKAIEGFGSTELGNNLARLVGLIATLAERGMENGPESHTMKVISDPLMTPTKSAEYLGISPQTLNIWRKRYEMESNGSGKARRYRKSELERIIVLRGGE